MRREEDTQGALMVDNHSSSPESAIMRNHSSITFSQIFLIELSLIRSNF